MSHYFSLFRHSMVSIMVLSIMVFIVPVTAIADDCVVVIDGIHYEIHEYDDYIYAYIIQVDAGVSGAVVIPPTVAGYIYDNKGNKIPVTAQVTGIDNWYNAQDDNGYRKGVFQDCVGLTSISLPGPFEISSNTFKGCTGLTSVNFADSVYIGIGEYAFSGCTGLKNLNFPDSVYIGEYAFNGCTGLKNVNFPDFVSIGEYAFNGCTSLSAITIPENASEIGKWAFLNCDNLTDLTWNAISCSAVSWFSAANGPSFPKTVKRLTVGENVKHLASFYGIEFTEVIWNARNCNNHGDIGDDDLLRNYEDPHLERVTIGEGVESLPDDFIYNSPLVSSINVPNSVKSIGESAFLGCGMTSLTIPNSVTSIGRRAFSGCTKMQSLTLPNSIEEIGEEVFYCCTNLASLEIPNSVKSIGYHAFASCTNLAEITIGNSVNYIELSSFIWCDNIERINVVASNSTYDSRDNCNAIIYTASNKLFLGCQNTIIPNTVDSIGDDAFYKREGLYSIDIPNSVKYIGKWAFAFTDLCSVTMGNSVNTICDHAFSSCKELTEIVIPASVTSLLGEPFAACVKLLKITCLAINPPAAGIWQHIIDQYKPYNQATLYVPMESVETYRTTYPWENFVNIVGISVENERGDVDGDGRVNIDDVTALISLLLSGNASGNLGADADEDGRVNIDDVTCLINYLLSRNW